jgi:hypothetical protein
MILEPVLEHPRRVTNAWLTMALWPVRSLGRQGSEVDRGSKGAKGEVGLAKGSPFHPMPPALAAATISKMPVKPLPPSSTNCTGVAKIRTTKTLTAYDAVGLELVREHPPLTEIRSHQRSLQPALSHSR